jgi:ABC-type glycerol-3-phosphate transport system substrate-binding protein
MTILAVVVIIVLVGGGLGYWYLSQPTTDKPTLKFIWTYPEYEEWGPEVAAAYMAENPDVEIETIVMDNSDMQESLSAWQAAGTLPDITFTNQMGAGSLRGMGIIYPLNEWWNTYEDRDKYLEGTVELATTDDNIWFMPQLVGGTGLAMRVDLVLNAGYDPGEIDTWDEWIAVMEAADDPGDGIYGIPLPLADDFMCGAFFGDLANSNGIRWVDVETELEQDKEKFIEVFDFIYQLGQKGLIHPDSYSLAFGDTAIAWGTGGAVYAWMGKFMQGMLGDQTELIAPETVYATTMCRGPHGQNTWLGIISGFWMSTTCEYKNEAFDFMAFANNRYNNAMLTAAIHDTARSDVTTQYRVDNFPEQSTEWWMDMWYDAMSPNLKTEQTSADYEGNYGIFTAIIVDVARGDLTPEAAFDQLETQLLAAIS